MQTAVYFECGTDIVPLLALQDTIQKFVLVESQSAFAFGSRTQHSDFFIRLRRVLFGIGFTFSRRQSLQQWIFVNRSTSTTVSLWVDCPFPLVKPKKMLEEISRATTLICCTYLPHKSILDLLQHPIRFVTSSDTVIDTKETDVVDVGMFQVWNLILLPPLWWSKHWTSWDVPRTLEYWCAEDMLTRHKKELHRLRLSDYSCTQRI